jgi:hypothetical protein
MNSKAGYITEEMEKKQVAERRVGHPSISLAFGGELGRKHASPSSIVGQNGRMLAHSASTLHGSSGGAIVDLKTFRFKGIRMK